MAFNSFLFTFVFLPITLAIYYIIAISPYHRWKNLVIVVATLGFYANAAARFLPLLLVSVLANYVFAGWIAEVSEKTGRRVLTAGVCMNVAALLYFKYTGFAVENLDVLLGLGLRIPRMVLPLAISFYTFQQIAFLIDASRGLLRRPNPLTYAASILFFPFIISGPITLVREVAPQLEAPIERPAIPTNLLIGLTIFAFGLFKKSVIADSFVLWVNPLYDQAAHGGTLGFAGAWGAAIGYLLQMYFDFSGYSDMAIGLARMLGVALPLNFFSPLRCTSVIDWWRRWHMTLGRWVNAYIFQPIALPLSRWAAARGFGRGGFLAACTLLPTFVTMVIIGAWHGGNWTYFLFGGLHGSYMVIAEVWRYLNRKKRKGKPVTLSQRVMGNVLTLIAVLIAVVPFRAVDVPTAMRIWSGMVNFGDFGSGIARWPVMAPVGGYVLSALIFGGLLAAYLLPNVQQMMSRYQPALEWATWREVSTPVLAVEWKPTILWSIFTGIVLLLALAFVARGSTSFVYFNF